jgi:hypothetical protein
MPVLVVLAFIVVAVLAPKYGVDSRAGLSGSPDWGPVDAWGEQRDPVVRRRQRAGSQLAQHHLGEGDDFGLDGRLVAGKQPGDDQILSAEIDV